MSTSSSAASIRVRSRRGDDDEGVEEVEDRRMAPAAVQEDEEEDAEDIFSGALPKLDSKDFRPNEKVKKKKKTGVLRKVGNALFGKRKKKDKSGKSQEQATVPTLPISSSQNPKADYSNFFREPEQWPDDLAAGGKVFSTLTASEEPSPHSGNIPKVPSISRAGLNSLPSLSPDHSTGTPMFFDDADDHSSASDQIISSGFPGNEDSSSTPPPTFNRKDTEGAAALPNPSQFEKPIVSLNQPAVVKPERPQQARWFGGESSKKGPSKEELKKREKRIAYLRQARHDLDEASNFGLDSMALPMKTLEEVEREERRKLKALLRETREGFEEFLNEFCKAVFARHGSYCLWRLSLLKSKYSANADVAGILKDVRKEELSQYSNAVEIFNNLAVQKTGNKIHWQLLCAQDAAMLTKIFIVRSQCLSLIRKYFSEEADLTVLHPLNDVSSSVERNWFGERDLNISAFETYTSDKKMEQMNLVERTEYLLRSVCETGVTRAQESHRQLIDDLQRLELYIMSLVDHQLDRRRTPGLQPDCVEKTLSVYKARFPEGNSKTDIFGVIRRVSTEGATRQFGSGFGVEMDRWDRQDIFHLNKWMTDAAFWQAYDIRMSQQIYKDQIVLADLRESKRKYLRQCLLEKLSMLWATNSLKIQKENLENLVDSLESTCTLGTSWSSAHQDERHMMAIEDSFGKMQLAWTQQYRDVKAKAKIFNIPLKTTEQVRHISESLLELLQALERDSGLLKDLELQTALDALQVEVESLESKKKSLKTKHAAQDQSLTKSLEQSAKKKEELLRELHEEEERADHLDSLKCEHDKLTAEIDELKDSLASLKASIKIKKNEKHSSTKNSKLAREVESLTRDVEKQAAILRTYSDSKTSEEAIAGQTPPTIHVEQAAGDAKHPEVESPLVNPVISRLMENLPESATPSTKRKKKLGGLFGKVVKAGKGSRSSKHHEAEATRRSTSDGELAAEDEDEESADDDEPAPLAPPPKAASLLSVKSTPHRHRSRSVAVLNPSAILGALGLQERKKRHSLEAEPLTPPTRTSEDKLSKTTLGPVGEVESLEVLERHQSISEVPSLPPTPAQNRTTPFGTLADAAEGVETAQVRQSQERSQSSAADTALRADDEEKITSFLNLSQEPPSEIPPMDSLNISDSEASVKGAESAPLVNVSEASGSVEQAPLPDSSPSDVSLPKVQDSPIESEQLPISFRLDSSPLVQLSDVPPGSSTSALPGVRRSWSNHSFGDPVRVPTVAVIPSSPHSVHRFDKQTRSDDDQASSVSLSMSAASEFGEKKKRGLWKKLLRRRH